MCRAEQASDKTTQLQAITFMMDNRFATKSIDDLKIIWTIINEQKKNNKQQVKVKFDIKTSLYDSAILSS